MAKPLKIKRGQTSSREDWQRDEDRLVIRENRITQSAGDKNFDRRRWSTSFPRVKRG